MEYYVFGNPESDKVLIQPVDEHDLAAMEQEIAAIRNFGGGDFRLLAVQVPDWNRDLSPWKAPPVFGREEFGGGAAETLAEILEHCGDSSKRYIIGGYSLAGLFALWAVCETDVFCAAAAASPSVWFPGFTDMLQTRTFRCDRVYLSLGDRETRARNPLLAGVGEKLRQVHELLLAQDVDCTLEWNPGNHFRDADLRTAKAFAWVLRSSCADPGGQQSR